MLSHDGQSAALVTSWISCESLGENQNMYISDTELAKWPVILKLDFQYNKI